MKKHWLCITVVETTNWVKPAWPAEAKLFASTSQMEDDAGDAGRAGWFLKHP